MVSVFYVERHNGRWMIRNNGVTTGPYLSRRIAIRCAVRLAAECWQAGIEADVVVVEPEDEEQTDSGDS